MDERIARGPGRVNLIGEHTDYTGGLALPLAIDRWTELRFRRRGCSIELDSADEDTPASLPLVVADPAAVDPPWARYVAGVVAEINPTVGLRGSFSTSIPIGAGLASSAALEVVIALALGAGGSPAEIARLCQRAEHRASGVPSGIMDQLTIAAGVAGHALLMDCASLSVEPVPIPEGAEIIVRFVAHRRLAGSPYADRVAECAAAERVVGPLRLAALADLQGITDRTVRARARHVVSENIRVRDTVAALRADDLAAAGALLVDGHRSLRDDYAVSTPAMDAAVEALRHIPGVYGARLTGGGFGGCVIALAEPGAVTDSWVVRAVAGASLSELP